jgi:hypothetical protein
MFANSGRLHIAPSIAFVSIAVGGASLILLCAAYSRSAHPDSKEPNQSQAIHLRDEAGRTRVSLELTSDGGELSFIDESGRKRAIINSGTITFFDREGHSRLLAKVGDDGSSEILLSGSDATDSLRLRCMSRDEHSTQITIITSSNIMTLNASESGSQLFLTDSDLTSVATLGSIHNQSPSLILKDRDSITTHLSPGTGLKEYRGEGVHK